MYKYRAILKRVGIVLIAVGILDIAYMVYCISQGQNYSSSLNIPAVVAGVFLFRGSLRAVPLITEGTAILIVLLVSNLFLLLPFFTPAELLATQFRLDPVGLSMPLLVRFTTVALLCWVYTQLRATPVVAASLKSVRSAYAPKLAFILGGAALLAGIVYFIFSLSGAAQAKAVELARTQYGENYKYHVTGLRWENGNVHASLTAYNEHEIKPVQVEWKQRSQ
ncbi:MAG: hypothetical protein Fur006_04060 [Coleofasciculaceae cyanobacterium]